jgi:flagellar biosynthetic protein FliR
MEPLINLYNDLDVFGAALARITGFVISFPVFSGTNIPRQIKLVFCLGVALTVYFSGVISPSDVSAIGYIFLFASEFITGALLAFAGTLVFGAVQMMGHLIDFQIGLSMASVFDPVSLVQSPVSANLYYYIVLLMFIESGGLNACISVLVKSYQYLPIGKFAFSASLAKYLIYLTQTAFLIGLRFAMPIIAALFLIDVGLGILVKVAPQANVFVVGAPIKLLAGYFVIFAIAPLSVSLYEYIFNETIRGMMELIRGLMQNVKN